MWSKKGFEEKRLMGKIHKQVCNSKPVDSKHRKAKHASNQMFYFSKINQLKMDTSFDILKETNCNEIMQDCNVSLVPT